MGNLNIGLGSGLGALLSMVVGNSGFPPFFSSPRNLKGFLRILMAPQSNAGERGSSSEGTLSW